jgi:hypothetical protein
MYDHSRNRSYQGKLFLFEKCLLYTETKNLQSQYRGHYKINEFGVYSADGNEKFSLFARKIGMQQVDFHGNCDLLRDWYDLLHKMLMDEAIQGERNGYYLEKLNFICLLNHFSYS